MCASLSLLRAGPPPPKAALLPDALFFTRAVPIAAGATTTDATAQVELALEALSPFPLAHLYYGWFWKTGAEHAFVFASYRRRFTTEQIAEWGDAEIVLPAFAATFGAEVQPSTTLLLAAPECLTAVHWDTPGVPAKVLTRRLAPEATDEDRTRVREELLRAAGGSRHVIDLATPLAADSASTDREAVFRSGEFVSRLPAATAAALDVRDKAELASRRAARRRDVLLWRVTVGCAAAIALLALGELALVGGKQWQKARQLQLNRQQPFVQKIMSSEELARKIDELATKRLLPLEMITELVGPDLERKPGDIQFTRMTTDKSRGLYTVLIDAQTTNPAQMNVYTDALKKLPSCQDVVVTPQNSRGDLSFYKIEVTFKPDALKPSPNA